MDKERRRELKRLGKKIVAQRSAQVERALLRSNPLGIGDEGWAENYREVVKIERQLRVNTTEVIPASSVGVRVVLLEYPECNPGRSRVAVPGVYIQCAECRDMIPSVADLALRCRCGGLAHGPSRPGADLGRFDELAFFKLLGKGRRRRTPEMTDRKPWWKFW